MKPETQDTMPILVIEATGEIISSNFEPFALAARQWLSAINRTLKDDDDFAQADLDAKKAKEVEDMLAATRERILAKAETLNAEWTRLAVLSGEMRDARLTLTKQIEKAKDERRVQVIEAELGMIDCDKSMRTGYRAEIEAAAKGKKTLETMREACRVARNVANDRIARSRKMIAEATAAHGSTIAPDSRSLECSDPVAVEAELRRRVEAAAVAGETPAKEPAEILRPVATVAGGVMTATLETVALGEPDEAQEWAAFRSDFIAAVSCLKPMRERLRHPANVAKAATLAAALNAAWKEVNQ